MILKHIRISLIALSVFTILTGVVYPLAVTGLAQLFFPDQANGSLIEQDGTVVGSRLIGQAFDRPEYFWSRLSATSPFPYNSSSSTGSNFGPLNPALFAASQERINRLHGLDPGNRRQIPVDLVTSSGSGLDPHITIAAAIYQVDRVARARNITDSTVRSLIDRFTQPRGLGFLGEPGVNVLELNLALDRLSSKEGK